MRASPLSFRPASFQTYFYSCPVRSSRYLPRVENLHVLTALQKDFAPIFSSDLFDFSSLALSFTSSS